MRVLHVNLAKSGIGRYGILYGRALGRHPGLQALSVFDGELVSSPLLRSQVQDVSFATIDWGTSKMRGLRELSGIAAEFKPDVIHDTGGCFARSLPVWLMLKRFGTLFITEHDPVPHVGTAVTIGERATRAAMPRLAHHVFVHGSRCRELVIRRGLAPDKVTSIRHGHLGMFDRGAHPDVVRRDQDILFFGEFRYNKGADLLLEISDRVREKVPEARFIVAGRPGTLRDGASWTSSAQQLLAEMKRRSWFEVHDRFIPDEDVEYFFRRAGITVMPYREATQSGIAMIAMPLGSVVVASHVGDIPEVVRHLDTGFLANPTAEDISRRLVEALEDPRDLSRIRRRAHEFVSKECAWPVIIANAADQYRRMDHCVVAHD